MVTRASTKEMPLNALNLKRRLRRKLRMSLLLGVYGCFLLCGALLSSSGLLKNGIGRSRHLSVQNGAKFMAGSRAGDDGLPLSAQLFNGRHLLQSLSNDTATVEPSTKKAFNQTTTTTMAPATTIAAKDKGNSTDECVHPAIDDFPADFMTPLQRSHGGLIVHALICAYVLMMIAIACDDYFVTSLEGISTALSLSSDVAGATFMAAGSSAPELFTNVVGTFVTEGDLGVGTIVGSAVFNILGVTAVCGLFSGPEPIPVDFWALTRDCLFYFLSVILLIIVMYNEVINWWEGAIFLVAYCVYILVMKYNSAIELKLKAWLQKTGWNVSMLHMNAAEEEKERTPLLSRKHRVSSICSSHSSGEYSSPGTKATSFIHHSYDGGPKSSAGPSSHGARRKSAEETNLTFLGDSTAEREEQEGYWDDLLVSPDGVGSKAFWIISWPARFLLRVTIPDCSHDRWKKYYPVTFAMSIVWVGTLSYLAAWMITVIGHTFGIPDSAMGLTFLAAGTSVPELASSLVVAKQGLGSMSMSNLVGSNTFDILVCLGGPWLIKAAMSGQVLIASGGLAYSAVALLSTVILMYASMFLNKFQLGKPVGISCLALYVLFLVVSLMVELNVFGVVNLPVCPTNA